MLEQILPWHPVHYGHQRISQSMAHLAQEGEAFVLVGILQTSFRLVCCNAISYKPLSVFSLKAWSFSCQQNRNVRAQKHEAEMKAERFVPSPLHMLLAYRDKYAAVKWRSSHLNYLLHWEYAWKKNKTNRLLVFKQLHCIVQYSFIKVNHCCDLTQLHLRDFKITNLLCFKYIFYCSTVFYHHRAYLHFQCFNIFFQHFSLWLYIVR